LAHRLTGLARDDARADRRLDRYLVELARNLLLKPFDERLARAERLLAVDHERERVDCATGEQYVQLDQVRLPIAEDLVVERGIATAPRLQEVVEVEHDL